MNKLIRTTESRTVRRARLAASALGVAVAVAGAAAITPAQGSAAASHGKHGIAALEQGLLAVDGTGAGETIALRLKAGQPLILQVDIDGDGQADAEFVRADVARIAVDGRGGDDTLRVDESNGPFGDIPTTFAGGGGEDTLIGGSGAETLVGGGGRDSIDGNRGNDLALMGGGEDTFVWDPGDGSDTVEGQGGFDTMLFNGANVAERVDLTANGTRLRFFRDIAGITMDTDGVERVDFRALGGADVVTVDDLSGTDVTDVNVDLGSSAGTGDGSADRVIVNGTNRNDRIRVAGDAAGVSVSGLAATVRVLHAEPASDRLEIETLAGSDTADSAGLAPGVIQLFVYGILVA